MESGDLQQVDRVETLRAWLGQPLPPVVAEEAPRVSVIVPSFNQAEFLEDCLRSIFLQAPARFEVIVMDGGSSDGSVEIIRRYAERIHYWQSQPDGGQAAAINAGLERARGQIVGWLNSDDLLLPGALLAIEQAVEQAGAPCWVQGGALEYFQAIGELRPYPWPHRMDPAKLPWAHAGCQPALYWHRDLGMRLDARLQFALDWDLQIRLSRTTPLVLLEQPLAINRIYEATKTRSGKHRMADEYYAVTRRYGNSWSRSLLYRYGIWAAVNHRNRHGETWLNRWWHRAAAGILRRLHGMEAIDTFNWYHFS